MSSYDTYSGFSRAGPSSYSGPTSRSPAVKTKRERYSDSSRSDNNTQLPSIVRPASPLLVPRNSSSSSSWGVAELSDSDGDYDWSSSYTSSGAMQASAASRSVPSGLQISPDLGKDDLASFARPAKRPHLDSQEDRQTYGQFADLHIRPASVGQNVSSSSRPISSRANSGMMGAFGLGSSLPFSPSSTSAAPPVPPSSPIKGSSQGASSIDGAMPATIYQQIVGAGQLLQPPPTSPVHAASAWNEQGNALAANHEQVVPSKRRSSIDLEDSDMRIRKAPTSYEIEPDRVVVTSLDDSSSSSSASDDNDEDLTEVGAENGNASPASSEFVINHELIEKLEAHRRAVMTGTSDRDNSAAAASSTGSTFRARRTGGRRSGASNGLSYLTSPNKRRSAQSSASSSGFATPSGSGSHDSTLTRGALILWKEPERIIKSTAASDSPDSHTREPGRSQDPTLERKTPLTVDDSVSYPAPLQSLNKGEYIFQPPVASSSGPTAAVPITSPLYAQQSSLSSSYFPSTPSPLNSHVRITDPTSQQPRTWSVSEHSPHQYHAEHLAREQQQQQQQQHPRSSAQQHFATHPHHHTSPTSNHSTQSPFYPTHVSDEMELDA